MKATELLKPRFEVIADYPFNPHKLGDILVSEIDINCLHQTTTTATDWEGERIKVENFCLPESFEAYPHLFRKLNWWENRKAEDMPTKLICKAIPGDKEVLQIQEWDMDILVGWTNKYKRECCSLRSFNPEYGYFPID